VSRGVRFTFRLSGRELDELRAAAYELDLTASALVVLAVSTLIADFKEGVTFDRRRASQPKDQDRRASPGRRSYDSARPAVRTRAAGAYTLDAERGTAS
jgi:hypothetical protein